MRLAAKYCDEINIDAGVDEMDPFTKSGEGRGEDVVASGAQARDYPLPAPATVQGAVDEDEGRHGVFPGTHLGTQPSAEAADDATTPASCCNIV